MNTYEKCRTAAPEWARQSCIFFHFCDNKTPCASLRTQANRRYFASQLGPGTPATHERSCLVLLRSRPDTVHRFPLRRTQTSAPLNKGSSTSMSPRIGITPAVADCRFRAPLSPRLRGMFNIHFFCLFVNSGAAIIMRKGAYDLWLRLYLKKEKAAR